MRTPPGPDALPGAEGNYPEEAFRASGAPCDDPDRGSGDSDAEALAAAIRSGESPTRFVDFRDRTLSVAALLELCRAAHFDAHQCGRTRSKPLWLWVDDRQKARQVSQDLQKEGIKVCLPVHCSQHRCLRGASVHLLAKDAPGDQSLPPGAHLWLGRTVCETSAPCAGAAALAQPRLEPPKSPAALLLDEAVPAGPAAVSPSAPAQPKPPPTQAVELGAAQFPPGTAEPGPASPLLATGPPAPTSFALAAPCLELAERCPLLFQPPVDVLGCRRAFTVFGTSGSESGELAVDAFDELEILSAAPLAVCGIGCAQVRLVGPAKDIGWVSARGLVSDRCDERAFILLAEDGHADGLMDFMECVVQRLGGCIIDHERLRQYFEPLAAQCQEKRGANPAPSPEFQVLLRDLHDRTRRNEAGVRMPGDYYGFKEYYDDLSCVGSVGVDPVQ